MITKRSGLLASSVVRIGRAGASPKLLFWVLSCAALFVAAPHAQGTTLFVGTLSYDTFIPSGPGTGIDAFNISNLTGAFSLPPDFPVTDSLAFQSASLTLTLNDLSQQVFTLGDIVPGFLLDMDGNPIVQVPGDQAFISAELTATLSASLFGLADGTSFLADSASLDVLLLPSSGPTLMADVDNTTINVSGSVQATVPEPASYDLALLGMSVVARGAIGKRRSWLSIRRRA